VVQPILKTQVVVIESMCVRVCMSGVGEGEKNENP